MFLQRTGAAVAVIGAPSLLAACGGDDSSSTAEKSSSSSVKGSTINFIGFQGDDVPEPLGAWKDSNDITVRSQYIQSAPDIIAKLKSGGSVDVDVMDFPNNAAGNFRDADLLAPLDESKIPNLAKLVPFLRTGIDHFTHDASGKRVAVPLFVGPFGITYAQRAGRLAGWSDLLKPEAKDSYAVIDYPFGNLSIVAVILGLDMGALTPQQGKECAALLKRFIANARTVAASLGQAASLLNSGQVTAAMPDGGTVLNLIPAQRRSEFASNIDPEGGNVLSVELYGMPPSATNVAGAHAFMNQVLDPRVNAAVAESLGQAVVDSASIPLLNRANRARYPYGDYESYLRGLKLYDNPPAQSSKYLTAPQWLEMYTALKA